MSALSLIKMHGLGNDFVIADLRSQNAPYENLLNQNLITKISDRNFGIGCDQFVLLRPSQEADIEMQIYNIDGSISGACGNASRCVASLILKETNKSQITIKIANRILNCWQEDNGLIAVDMGKPQFLWQDIPLTYELDQTQKPLNYVLDQCPDSQENYHKIIASKPELVNIGNPHAVFFENNLEFIGKNGRPVNLENILSQKTNLFALAQEISTDNEVFAQGTNVEFVKINNKEEIDLIVYERGVGPTLACGSGACAAVISGIKRGILATKVAVNMPGSYKYQNDQLIIKWKEGQEVIMIGPVSFVARIEYIL